MKRLTTGTTVIGACEARTRLPELLREVRAGRRFTITRRGDPIADLVPSTASRAVNAAAAVDRFRAYMREHPIDAGRRIDVRALFREGRSTA
jgi:prevent-host-death family protein